MSDSYSFSETQAFTATHAKYLASKIATDLKRIQRFYSSPSDQWIASYEAEAVEFLKKGYLGTVTYGFQKDGKWIEPTLHYTARDLADILSAADDDPGRIRPGANIEGAHFTSYLTKSAAWSKLSAEERSSFEKSLPFIRTGAPEPGINGTLTKDKTYSSAGRALDRSSVKSNL